MITYTLSDEKIAHIHLDDGKANALGPALIAEFMSSLARAENEAKAVCVSGRPGRFCAGFDLKIMTKSPMDAVQLLTQGKDLFLRLYSLRVPLIMACTGHAIAGGALMLLCADARIGVEGEFKLGLNEVPIGMTLPRLGVELARDRLDPRKLTESVVLGKLYAPAEAREVGYLDAVVPPEYLQAAVDATCLQLAQLDSNAHHGTKMRVRGATIDLIENTFADDIASFSGPKG
ncbi:MAG: crotonase/enoyl-CoA hydratase family protein [Bradymonadia bacterium]